MRKLLLMAKYCLVLVLLCSFQKAKGQQDPLYTNYMFNKIIYNPAYAGVNPGYIYVTSLAHNQWSGFTGDADAYVGRAPSTQTFDISVPFGINSILGGAGMSVIRDLSGFENNMSTNFIMSIKKHFNFGSIFLGINAGFIQRQINNTFWRPPGGNLQLYDPLIPQGLYNDIIPDIGAGIYVVNRRYFIGLSSQHLLGGEFQWGGSKNTLVRHSYLTAGYNFVWPTNPNIEIQPSFLIKTDKTKVQYDINTNVMYKNRYWAGLQYRDGDAVSMLLGIMLMPCLRFGYSYDLTLTDMNDYSYGTHEIVITYCFRFPTVIDDNPRHIIWTPRFL